MQFFEMIAASPFLVHSASIRIDGKRNKVIYFNLRKSYIFFQNEI